jgi:SdpI/YfhL protein family
MIVGILIIAIVDMLVGFLLIAIHRPLVQGKIGRNAFYGFRTPKTLASDKAWYAVNHGAAKTGVYMAIGMVIFGIVVALLSILMALLPSTKIDYMEETVLIAAIAAPLVFIIGLGAAMNIELKKLDKDSLADPEQMF